MSAELAVHGLEHGPVQHGGLATFPGGSEGPPGEAVPVTAFEQSRAGVTALPVAHILAAGLDGVVLYRQDPTGTFDQTEVTQDDGPNALDWHRHGDVVVVLFQNVNPRLVKRTRVPIEDVPVSQMPRSKSMRCSPTASS